MNRITAHDPEAHSADVVSGNLRRLKALFPEAFVEGKVDFAVLKQLLGDQVDEREEKYDLDWHGKRRARQLALTPSTGTLRPCPEDSVDWETTRNLMIEGDNLEVLKILQKGYTGKVKLIYIDPPYNTGKDFVYPDDYRDNIRHYLDLTGQTDGENRRLSSNTETSGRFHTDWLNMMYPRLTLAHNLLRSDGVIFVSVDDTELGNQKTAADFLKKLEKPLNMAELAKERLRRAEDRIGDGRPLLSHASGFRVFKLDTSNIRAWEPNHDDLERVLLDSVDHVKPDRNEEDVLYELLLKLGLDLCLPVETRITAGKPVRSVGAGTLITCLDPHIDKEEIKPLAFGISDWCSEMAATKDSTVIFRDSAFADDVAKINLAAILEQHGFSHPRSL